MRQDVRFWGRQRYVSFLVSIVLRFYIFLFSVLHSTGLNHFFLRNGVDLIFILSLQFLNGGGGSPKDRVALNMINMVAPPLLSACLWT